MKGNDKRRGKYKISYIDPFTKKRRKTKKTWKKKSTVAREVKQQQRAYPEMRKRIIRV